MADEDKKPTRAELAEAVRELREEVAALRAERAAHSCHGHGCWHAHCNWGHCGCWTYHSHSYPLPAAAPYPVTWTVATGNVVTSGNLNVSTLGIAGGGGIPADVVTNFAAGVPQVVTLGTVN